MKIDNFCNGHRHDVTCSHQKFYVMCGHNIIYDMTLSTEYNKPCYNMDLDITWWCYGSQIFLLSWNFY